MVELSNDRYADLIIAEYHLMRIRRIVEKKIKEFGTIRGDELEILRDLICPMDNEDE